ncbi:T9SS type A sorting domain-containing protein [Changchengzhania lutea]|uniref:T9SS type A sorting domain-containing protein n=1 Tax=Changchengzhania lutea TaxID=2049305 RepID=UPI00115D9A04|nr:T9SS type A sorting domain-containing protein [Changchengzhania lutea]
MQNLTYKSSLTFLIGCLFVVSFGFGQIKLAEVNFEKSGGYSTSIPEFTDFVDPGTGTDGRDYFIRTDGANIRAEIFTNKQGSYYFTAQDHSADGRPNIARLFLNNLNVSGYSNLVFKIHLAEDDLVDGSTNHWDNPDYVHIGYDIDDTGIYSDLLWIEGSGGDNSAPRIDTDFDGTGDGTEITDEFVQFSETIGGIGSLLDIQIEFRLNAEGEDIAIDNIEIWGTLDPCGSAVTWDGSSWDNAGAGPDITTPAIINADFNTGTNGSFSACNLTVSNDSDLFIADNTFVEIQNDIRVDALSSIDIAPTGAIVQRNDFSDLINSGSMSVDKITAPMDAWYEYTYWSSPVSNETIVGAIPDSEPSRRFVYNGQDFLDATAESNNDNSSDSGQDDVDDDGNDWARVDSTTVMEAGVGYATTLTEFAYNIVPGTSNKSFRFTFTGDFHNGVYKIPVYRNDSEMADNNWNLIGNPYPSAIDADLFLEVNSAIPQDISGIDYTGIPYIDGAIFLWSQDTNFSANNNGNEALNFSASDYAIINGSGETAGGDGIQPNRFIPSGQAFFVSMSNDAPADLFSGDVYTTEVRFNNGMRTSGTTDNSQFFKNSYTKKSSTLNANKLWIDLTSDNGVYNQTLVAYINGASNDDDGAYFDARKSPSAGTSAILYTIIENSDKKFAIQGKSPHSLNEDEIIPLGFSTTIDVATLYKLSIAQLEGDFLDNNPIFLNDKLLNTVHDLSASDYSFTSEVGEFNERFEIAFTASAFSTEELRAEQHGLKIIESNGNRVQFSVNPNLNIKTVVIFDVLGRPLYNLKGTQPTETFTLSNLKNTVYIAKVTLSNGAVITKKALKK